MIKGTIKLLYINDEFLTSDGSNSHAIGMLHAFEDILGSANIRVYPTPEDGSTKPINFKVQQLHKAFKNILQIIRYFRKRYSSIIKSNKIFTEFKKQNFIPTHIVARSTIFDTTAIYLAKKFNAKLIYEINSPLYYECGVIQKKPLLKEMERWERQIIENADLVYTVSSICRDMLCEHYKLSSQNFIVIPNGYMKELYIETEMEKQKIRNEIRQLEHLEDKYIIVFIGSLKIWHGIKSLCEVAELLENNKNIFFLVLGDGDGHELILDYITSHNNMLFKGKVDLQTMKYYLYAADLGIMPYASKDYFYFSPLKMFEMIGAGIPFVGTAIGQIEELCSEWGLEEMLIKNNEASTIATAIKDWTEKDITEIKRKIQHVRQNTDWNTRTNILIQKMKQML